MNKKIDNTFEKALDQLAQLKKVFREHGKLEKALLESNQDISGLAEINRAFDALTSALNANITQSLTEGVLDDQDEDGFMARSQLYFMAKDAIALHGMIDDRDDLEPWVHTKIVAASEGIDAVRRYMEYRGVQTPTQEPEAENLPMPVEEAREYGMFSPEGDQAVDGVVSWIVELVSAGKLPASDAHQELEDHLTHLADNGHDEAMDTDVRERAAYFLTNKLEDMDLDEGWETLPTYNKEKYQERPGLEGPFPTRSGKVVYYDPKAGSYYDPDTDMYLSYDDWKELDGDAPLRNEVTEAKLSPEQRDELDDLIDMVKYGTSPSTYDDNARDEAMQALKTIRSKFGDKVADQVEDGIHDFHFPKYGATPGTYGTDRLASKKPTAIKKDGKIDSRSAKSTKRDIKYNLRGMGKKDPKRLGEATETKYGIIRYPDTAISYIKNDGNGWEHIFDKSYGFEGPVDKEDLQYASKIAKEKIPSRMLEENVNEGMEFDDKRNDDLKSVATDMFKHAKEQAKKSLKVKKS
jgi:hypothetical protein